MLRRLLSSQPTVERLITPKVTVRVPKQRDFCSTSLKGMIDGLIVGFVIGGIMGIMQGWINDAKTKDFALLSSSWALNGAAIGAVAITLTQTIVSLDMTPKLYTVR